MPKFNSFEGEWQPAHEKVALINHSAETQVINGEEIGPGEPYIYSGKDRAALKMLYDLKEEKMGDNFRKSPDFIAKVRQFGFENVDKYLEFIGYDADKHKKEFEDYQKTINTHKAPKKKKGTKRIGGGKDFSNSGKDRYGDFGLPPEVA